MFGYNIHDIKTKSVSLLQEAAWFVADETIQILGGMGFMKVRVCLWASCVIVTRNLIRTLIRSFFPRSVRGSSVIENLFYFVSVCSKTGLNRFKSVRKFT